MLVHSNDVGERHPLPEGGQLGRACVVPVDGDGLGHAEALSLAHVVLVWHLAVLNCHATGPASFGGREDWSGAVLVRQLVHGVGAGPADAAGLFVFHAAAAGGKDWRFSHSGPRAGRSVFVKNVLRINLNQGEHGGVGGNTSNFSKCVPPESI